MAEDLTKTEWRGQGHLFNNLSSKEQGYVRGQTDIPLDSITPIPDKKLSVLDFARARLPSLCENAASYQVPKGHVFFRFEAPSKDYADILSTIMVPPRPLVVELLPKRCQAWLDGHNSINLPGSSSFLPIWSPQVWADLYQKIKPAQDAWRKAINFLQSNELASFKEQVHSAFHSLSTLSWYGNLAPAVPGRMSFPKILLTSYLSRDWMSDENIDQMLYLLEREVLDTKSGLPFHFMDTIHIRKLLDVYAKHQDATQLYDPHKDSDFLQRFGQALTFQSRIGAICHVRGNHWVPIAIDLASQVFFYGDSAQGPCDVDITSALRWFLSQHVPSLESLDELDDENLPCSKQNLAIDTFNCGLFSFNALRHHFLPAHPLLKHTETLAWGDLGRISILKDLIRTHVEALPDDHAIQSEVFKARLGEYNLSRPVTPPNCNSNEELTNRLKRLSVSPKKPAAKKQKIGNQAAKSVIAPIFKQASTLGPKAQEYKEKPESEKLSLKFGLRGRKPGTVDTINEETEVDSQIPTDVSDCEDVGTPTPLSAGRPRLDVLDQLTVEVPTPHSQGRTYQCIGEGCTKRWKPRAKARVLAHCKNCLKLSREQRAIASTASSEHSPGALVAASSDLKTLKPVVRTQPKTSVQPALPRSDSDFFGSRSRKELHQQLDLAIVKLICTARLPPNLVDQQEWKEIFALQTPSYTPASRTKLMDNHIMSEQEHVRQKVIEKLQAYEGGITISFDGGSLRSGDQLYTVHANTLDFSFMLDGRDCTGFSHTGGWIAEYAVEHADIIGIANVIGVSSDTAGNTRVAREIIVDRIPTILNLPDPNHHLNNMWKDIASISYFGQTVRRIRGTIKYFKNSNHSKYLLAQARERLSTGAGLESIGKTRFGTLAWSALSVKRSLPALRDLCSSGQVEIPKYNNIYISSSMETLQFEFKLTQFTAVGEPIARVIECLEAASVNPADVYLYWLALLARLKESLETSQLPDDVCGEIRGIVNDRWHEFFIAGPTNVYLAAFYLNPNYVRSSIFKKPNPLAFSITLPAKNPSPVPPGIQNPKTFLEVGGYLHSLLVTEINHGANPFLTAWKNKPQSFTKRYQQEFTAYAQGAYPFTTPLSLNQSPLAWWKGYENCENGGILAAIAIKLYSVVPHSMADERTMSTVTMLNTAQRNRQKVGTVVAMAQIGGWYKHLKPVKTRKSAHPQPTLKFFDIKRLLRSIDDEESPAKLDINYDESEDEEDVDLTLIADDGTVIDPEHKPKPVLSTATALPLDGADDDIDMSSPELVEILADAASKPRKMTKSAVPTAKVLQMDEEAEESGDFELSAWV